MTASKTVTDNDQWTENKAERSMSQRQRKGQGTKRGSGLGMLWAGGLLLLVAILIIPTLGFGGGHHPEPRAEAERSQVQDATRYAAYPRVQEIYRQVAEIPQVIDGLYCYCECSNHSGHYSLLDCFRDDHAAMCDVCLSEAALAYRMTMDGSSLDEIRDAIDRLYKT